MSVPHPREVNQTGRGAAHEGFIFLSLSSYPGDLNVQPRLRITDLRRVSVSKRFHQIKKKTRYYLFPILPRETDKRCHREKSRERTAVKKAVGQGVFLSAPCHYFFPRKLSRYLPLSLRLTATSIVRAYQAPPSVLYLYHLL